MFEGVGEPLSTNEVCDDLEVGRRSTYDRLDRLRDAGRLRTKAVGARGRVWWLPHGEDTSANRLPNDDETTADADSARADRAWEDSGESALPAALDEAPMGVAIFNADGRLVDASAAFASHLGIPDAVTHETLAGTRLVDDDGDRIDDPVDAVWTNVDDDHGSRRL